MWKACNQFFIGLMSMKVQQIKLNEQAAMNAMIETDRLYLREILPEDAPGMFEMDADPDVHRFLGRSPITSIAQAAADIENIRQQYIDNGVARIAIIEKSSNDFVGWGGLKLRLCNRISQSGDRLCL